MYNEVDANVSQSSSVNSIDDVLAAEDSDLQADVWTEELRDRVEQILDRKRSSVSGREESLAAYCRLLTGRYMQEEMHSRTDDLVAAFLKSVKAESSEKETAYALKGEHRLC